MIKLNNNARIDPIGDNSITFITTKPQGAPGRTNYFELSTTHKDFHVFSLDSGLGLGWRGCSYLSKAIYEND